MTIPARPTVFQPQLPASRCQIDGKHLGGLSCSAYGQAHLIDRSTLGQKRPTGCEVREHTGDTTAGLTLKQVADVATRVYGVPMEVRVGPNVCTPRYAALQLAAGKGMLLQGNTSVLIGTPLRSTATGINHLIEVNQARGGTLDVPAEVHVYDSAADGRLAGWGRAASGPDWWPWSLVLRFAAALRPWGDQDPRVLGPGRLYAGFGPDTEPHVHLYPGARRMVTLPNRKRVKGGYNVRETPGGKPVAKTVAGIWEIWQAAEGAPPPGSTDRRWWGDHYGRRWIHNSALVR